jgi:hypothetical protein
MIQVGSHAGIQVGSKEEVAFLLALFGCHTQPVKRPAKSRQA